MKNITKLRAIFDNYLLQHNKSSIGIRTANDLINNSGDVEIQTIDLRKVLELGLISNSYVNSSGQWRITLSTYPENLEDANIEEEESDEDYISANKLDNSFFNEEKTQKENGKKILFATVAVLALIYFTLIKPAPESSAVSSYKSSGSSAVYVVNTTTYGATSKSALDDMYIYLSNNDQIAFATAMINGEILEISAGTDVYVKKNHFSYTIVKIPGRTDDIYIVTDHITKK